MFLNEGTKSIRHENISFQSPVFGLRNKKIITSQKGKFYADN